MAKTFAERIRETQSAVAANLARLLAQEHKAAKGQGRGAPRKTQAGLADVLGIAQTTVSRWVTGQHPIPPEHFERIAAYFQVSVRKLSAPRRRTPDDSGQHPVSPAPAPGGDAGSRAELDRPAAERRVS